MNSGQNNREKDTGKERNLPTAPHIAHIARLESEGNSSDISVRPRQGPGLRTQSINQTRGRNPSNTRAQRGVHQTIPGRPVGHRINSNSGQVRRQGAPGPPQIVRAPANIVHPTPTDVRPRPRGEGGQTRQAVRNIQTQRPHWLAKVSSQERNMKKLYSEDNNIKQINPKSVQFADEQIMPSRELISGVPETPNIRDNRPQTISSGFIAAEGVDNDPNESKTVLPTSSLKSQGNIPLKTEKTKELLASKSNSSTFHKSKYYPKGIFFIATLFLAHDFGFYGVTATIAPYIRFLLTSHDGMETNTAHLLAGHIYNAFWILSRSVYCVLGGFLADAYLGNYSVCLWMTCLLITGMSILSFGTIPNTPEGIEYLPQQVISFFGLAVINIGFGATYPTLVVFGGDQFSSTLQRKEVAQYFRIVWVFKNLGVFFGSVGTTELQFVECMNRKCHLLAYGVILCVMFVSWVAFILASPLYVSLHQPEENNVSKFFRCIWYAWRRKRNKKKISWIDSKWLNTASEKFGYRFVCEVKATLKILTIGPFIAFFFCGYHEVNMAVVVQGMKMDGLITEDILLSPNAMEFLNPLLVLILTPIFGWIIYPVLERFNLMKRPLHILFVGGCFVVLASIACIVLDTQLPSSTDAPIPTEKYGMEIYDRLSQQKGCEVTVFVDEERVDFDKMLVFDSKHHTFWFTTTPQCGNVTTRVPRRIALRRGRVLTFFLLKSLDKGIIQQSIFEDNILKPENELSVIKFFWFLPEVNYGAFYLKDNIADALTIPFVEESGDTQKSMTHKLGKFPICYRSGNNSVCGSDFLVRSGAAYDILATMPEKGKVDFEVIEKVQPNKLSIFWLLPESILVTIGEILFLIQAFELVFRQTPHNLKAFTFSLCMCFLSIGNLINIIMQAVIIEYIHRLIVTGVAMFINMGCLLILSFYVSYTDDIESIYEEKEVISYQRPSRAIRFYRDVTTANDMETMEKSTSTTDLHIARAELESREGP